MSEDRIPINVIDESPVNVRVSNPTSAMRSGGRSPYFSRETNSWWEYDDEQQAYIDTGRGVEYEAADIISQLMSEINELKERIEMLETNSAKEVNNA